METAVKKILAKIDANNLPAVPRVLLDLIQAIREPNASLDELTKIISQDTGLSAKIIATANSPLYRRMSDVTDLNRVLLLLGLSTLKTIAITKAVQQFFTQLSHAQQNSLELIWYRSLNCALLAKKIATLTAYEFPDEAYLAGLLHRIGQLVLLDCFPKEYAELLDTQNELTIENGEKKLFGANHYEIGAFLIENWQLQSLIADAVLYQQQPAEAIRDVTKIVKTVNVAAKLSCSNNEISQAAFDQAQQFFGISRFLLEEIISDNKKLVEQTAESYGINISVSEKGLVNHTSATQRNALQKFLGEQVKEIALTAISHQQLQSSTSLSHLVSHIQRDLNLLFGLQASAVFIYQDANHSLQGLAHEQENSSIWSSISISLNPGISLVAKALKQDELMFSSGQISTELEPIVDRQMRRILGGEQLLAIPLNISDMPVGVIVAGIHEHQNVQVKNQSAFIKLFASEVGQAIQQTQHNEYSAQQQIEQLQSSYRLHAKKMAHEINNPLSIINNYLYLLGLKLGNHADNEIKLIQDEINRVGQLLLNLPDLPEQPPSETSYTIDINTLVQDVTHLFSMGVLQTQAVELKLTLDTNAVKFSGSRNKLKQVLINLIKNAAEAMPDGGIIHISTKNAVYLGKKSYSQIVIADNGPGLPDTVKDQLYKPVKSGKGEQHKGLGLAISKTLIDELRGTMILSSSESTGTTVQILLP